MYKQKISDKGHVFDQTLKGGSDMACKNLKELLQRFDNEIGISGYEVDGTIIPAIKEEMEGYYDEYIEDNMHNQIFVKKGKGDKKVLLASHMDELGFIVTYVEEDGMVRFAPIGLHDDRGCIDQKLCIHTKKGPVYGVTGSKPDHILTDEERKSVLPIPTLFIDIGATSRKEANDMGVFTGSLVSWTTKGEYLNGTNTYSGKSVDNRAGCAIMVEVMRRLHDEGVDNVTFYGVGTVQEELLCRGAAAVGHRIQPDIALSLDVTLAFGPDVEEKQVPMKFGGGACVKMFDFAYDLCVGTPVPTEITEKMMEVAEEKNINYQREVLIGGTTDSHAIQISGDGIKAGAISLPSRYIHTAIGTVHLQDLQDSVDLIVEYVKTL